MKKLSDSQYVILLSATFLLGFIGMLQFRYSGFINTKNTPDELESRALRVSTLFEKNLELSEQLKVLETQKTELESSFTNNTLASDILDREELKYKVIIGSTEISGPGVELTIGHKLLITQVVDLVNSIRNSGAEGLVINGRRVIYNTPLEQLAGNEKYLIQIVGDKDVIYDALTRPGGVLEQITNGTAFKKDELILPKVN